MSNEQLIEQVRRDMDRLRGRLFQLVEATGMADGQQHAFKGCIRSTTYDAQAELESALRREP